MLKSYIAIVSISEHKICKKDWVQLENESKQNENEKLINWLTDWLIDWLNQNKYPLYRNIN